MAHVVKLIVFAFFTLVKETEVGVDMVGKDLELVRIVGIERKLEALVLCLPLLTLQHVEKFNIFLRV